MTKLTPNKTPKKNLAGFLHNWRSDLIAGFSVALVAFPLSMGIALAAGAPPMSGIISAVIGGLVTTFYRGSYVAINGPANALIVVTFMAINVLEDGSGNGFSYVLAAFIVSGCLQVIIGFLKGGKYTDFIPASVIHGILASIGIIILGEQIHVALGTTSHAKTAMGVLLEIPESIMQLNPFVTIISVVGLLVLIFHHDIKNKFIHFVPSAMWVLVFTLPFVFLFGFKEPHQINFLGASYYVGPEYLVKLPDDIINSLIFPNFSKIGDPMFWLMVITITLILSMESLVSAKAVDKMDPFKRKTRLNKDLAGVGVSSIISGFLGGLPIATVIARSSVNVNHGAKTSWSNFFHGVIVILFVLLFEPIIQKTPLAALAAILVYTGYKLASPKVFVDVYRKGWEQLLILLITIFCTLTLGLLWGIFLGTAFSLIVHYFRSGLPLNVFIKYLTSFQTRIIQEKDSRYHFKVKGIANFFNILFLMRRLDQMPKKQHVIVDFSHARLVDYTVLEFIHEYADKYKRTGGEFDVIGLDIHQTSSDHPNALHILEAQVPKKKRLTGRQLEFNALATKHGWTYESEINWEIEDLQDFLFFQTRPIEFKKNTIYGEYPDIDVNWEVSDITFDEGALIATEVYHTTIQVVHLPFEIPVFSLEKEDFLDKLLEFAGYEDIDFKRFKDFSDKFLLKGRDEEAMRRFFTPALISFFEGVNIYHLESNGNSLVVFKYLRLASPKEILRMIGFSEQLARLLQTEYAQYNQPQ